MRVSTSMQYRNHLSYLQTANSNLDAASQRYNTGLRFQTAGEDPGGMAAKIKYQSDIESYKRYSANANLVADTLSQEETALGQIWDCMSSIQTRLIQGINGTLDDGSRAAIAEDIKQTRDQIFNLMNTKNAEGEYIFSGASSDRPTYNLTSDGQYVCQADGSTKWVNVSPTIKVQSTDSGLNIFENVNLANDFEVKGTQGIPAGFNATISDYDQFNSFFKDYFDYGTGGAAGNNANNDFVLEFDGDGGFVLKDENGTEVGKGTLKDGKAVINGMEFRMPEGYEPAAGDQIGIGLKQPEQDNILNQLTGLINKLTTPEEDWPDMNPPYSRDQMTRDLAMMQETLSIAKKQVDTYRGMVGARGANIDAIIKSNETLQDTKSEAKANVSEIDAFTAVSDLLQTSNALQVAQQSYNIVHSTTLFDFM